MNAGNAFNTLFTELRKNRIDLHAMVLYKDGQCVLEHGIAPYSADDKREMYSVSKSFTSTAFGVAFDRGLVSPEDRLLKWFPEYEGLCAGEPRWQKVKLRHLLSMSTGHAACVMPSMIFTPSSAESFFSQPLVMEPGSAFVYNTGATAVIAQVVRRAMGMPVPEVLARYVFPALGIDDFRWECNADGECAGGVGINISCRDLAQLGLLYLNKGLMNGTRILSEEWVDMATCVQITNAENGSPDWCAGYGFQFWRNARQGYRGDGAYGQACFVLPEQGVVCAIVAEALDMGVELTLVQDAIPELIAQGQTEPCPCYLPEGEWHPGKADTGWIDLASNAPGWLAIRLLTDEKGAKLQWLGKTGVQTITAPAGEYCENTLCASHFRPSLCNLLTRLEASPIRLAAAAHSEGTDTVLDCRCLNNPHRFAIRITKENGKTVLLLESGADLFTSEKRMAEK